MILFEESDLYAVIYYLKIKHIVSTLKIIWVQESIKQAFKWHIKKYLTHFDIPICIFQSKQDLLTLENISIFSEIKILSIWSEDIVGARNFAMSFKVHNLNYKNDVFFHNMIIKTIFIFNRDMLYS